MCYVLSILLWVWVWSRGKEFQGLGKKTPVVRMCMCTCDCKADLFVMTRGLNRGQHPSASLNTARKLLPDTRARQTTNYCTCHSIPPFTTSYPSFPPSISFALHPPQTCKLNKKHTRNQWHSQEIVSSNSRCNFYGRVVFTPSIPIGAHTPTDRPTRPLEWKYVRHKNWRNRKRKRKPLVV